MTIAALVAPTVAAYPAIETQAAMNAILADLTTKINEISTTVNGMTNPAAVDLSGYTTHGELDAHKASYDHTGAILAESGIAAKHYVFQIKSGVLVAGSASVSWTTSYAAGALVGAWVVDTTATPAAIGLSAQSTTGATVKGTGTNTFIVFAVGYV